MFIIYQHKIPRILSKRQIINSFPIIISVIMVIIIALIITKLFFFVFTRHQRQYKQTRYNAMLAEKSTSKNRHMQSINRMCFFFQKIEHPIVSIVSHKGNNKLILCIMHLRKQIVLPPKKFYLKAKDPTKNIA